MLERSEPDEDVSSSHLVNCQRFGRRGSRCGLWFQFGSVSLQFGSEADRDLRSDELRTFEHGQHGAVLDHGSDNSAADGDLR